MAEKVGFEPTVPCGITGFQDQLLKPLGHLSVSGVAELLIYITTNSHKSQVFFKKLLFLSVLYDIMTAEADFKILKERYYE